MYQTKNDSREQLTVLVADGFSRLSLVMMSLLLLLLASVVNANNAKNVHMKDNQQAEVAEVTQGLSKESYLAYADQLLGEQKFKLALKYYDKVIRLDRDIDAAFLGRSIANDGAGRLEESIADLNVYILRNPDDSMAHVYRGVRYMSRGDMVVAETNLLKAIELDPRNARAYDDTGVLYARQGYLEHSLKYFGQALRLDPYNETAYHNLAIVYYLQEVNDKALIAVNRAIRLTPEAYDTYILKAQILDALGKVEEAKKVRHYAKFLNADSWKDSASIH